MPSHVIKERPLIDQRLLNTKVWSCQLWNMFKLLWASIDAHGALIGAMQFNMKHIRIEAIKSQMSLHYCTWGTPNHSMTWGNPSTPSTPSWAWGGQNFHFSIP